MKIIIKVEVNRISGPPTGKQAVSEELVRHLPKKISIDDSTYDVKRFIKS